MILSSSPLTMDTLYRQLILVFLSSLIVQKYANETSVNTILNSTTVTGESIDSNLFETTVSGLKSFLRAISDQLLPISSKPEEFLEKQGFLRSSNTGMQFTKVEEPKEASTEAAVLAGREYVDDQRINHVATNDPTDSGETNDDDDFISTTNSIEASDRSTSPSFLGPQETSRKQTYFRRRQSWRASDYCLQYSEMQLYEKLEQVGALNQRYMANSPEDAGRNFAYSYDTVPSTLDDLRATAFADEPAGFNKKQPFECGEYCQELIWKLNDALKKEQNGTILTWPVQDAFSTDDGDDVESSGLLTAKKSCSLGTFIPAGRCVLQGTEVFKDHSKLCSACHGVYVLGKDCFPRFLSAVRCDEMSTACIFDRIAGTPHGICRMRTLSFKVLHNKGNEQCQEWLYEYVEVPVACECYLERRSFFLSPMKP